MDDEKEIGEGNAFDRKDPEDAEKIDLPELFREEVIHRKATKRIFLVMLSALTLLVCIFIFAFLNKERAEVEIPLPVDTDEEWRGAFSERNIYESAMKSSVGLRVGKGDKARIWSGVIMTDSGWIATTASAADISDQGRIYVTLSDGREYEAESIYRRGETAAIKISAVGLCAVERAEVELHAGERVCIIENGRDVLTGAVTNTYSDIEVDASIGQSGDGAPVFGDDGSFIGLICSAGARARVVDVKGLFEYIKEK